MKKNLFISKSINQCGTSLVEVALSITLLGYLLYGGTDLINKSFKARQLTAQASKEIDLLSYFEELIINKIAWQNTLNAGANASLKDHLYGVTSSTTTSALQNFALYNIENSLIVPTSGEYFDDRLNVVVTAELKKWFVEVKWEGRVNNTSDIYMYLTPVVNGTNQTQATKLAKIFKRKHLVQRCITVTQILIAGQAPTHPDLGPYHWDKVDISCPSPYIRTSINVKPGCGAINYRVWYHPTDMISGSCHQVSAVTWLQKWYTGCDAVGSVMNATCYITCCNFED